MLAQAARMADGSNYAAPERFFLIETEGGYAVWDDIRDEIVPSAGYARTSPGP